jgi:hypothetical protein
VLLHDEEHGTEMIDALARHAMGCRPTSCRSR